MPALRQWAYSPGHRPARDLKTAVAYRLHVFSLSYHHTSYARPSFEIRFTFFDMRPTVVTVLTSIAAFAAAQTNVAEYYWSYAPANYAITAPHGYDPSFAVCGNSCEACDKDAKECFSVQGSNTCYEPKKGEHCCRDLYGSTKPR